MSNQPEHPSGGECLGVSVNGQLYINPANKAYMDSLKTSKSLDRIKSDSVSNAGFSKSRKIEESRSERELAMDRLAILQNTEARLAKDLERTRKVIASIKQSLQDN